jgi:hypothetical protein
MVITIIDMEVVVGMDTAAIMEAIIALAMVAFGDNRALADCFLSYLIVAVKGTMVMVAALIVPAKALVVITMLVGFFVQLKTVFLISMAKVAVIFDRKQRKLSVWVYQIKPCCLAKERPSVLQYLKFIK